MLSVVGSVHSTREAHNETTRRQESTHKLEGPIGLVFQFGVRLGCLWQSLRCRSERSFWGLRSENVASTPATHFPF